MNVRDAYAWFSLALVAAWLVALLAGASFERDLAYACALLGGGAGLLQRYDRRRRSR